MEGEEKGFDVVQVMSRIGGDTVGWVVLRVDRKKELILLKIMSGVGLNVGDNRRMCCIESGRAGLAGL